MVDGCFSRVICHSFGHLKLSMFASKCGAASSTRLVRALPGSCHFGRVGRDLSAVPGVRWHCRLGASGGVSQKRSFSASGETAGVAPDQLQALAARIMNDREFAVRLAQSPATTELIRAAEDNVGANDAASDASAASKIQERLVSGVPLPSTRQRRLYFLNNFLPFVGFGFVDNFIMLIIGDLVDAKIGFTLGVSTLACAAVGNTVSDVVGIWASGFIETANAAMGIPRSGLTSEQRADIRMRILKNTACAMGITVGCILGMAPLAYPEEWRLWQSRASIEQHVISAGSEVAS